MPFDSQPVSPEAFANALDGLVSDLANDPFAEPLKDCDAILCESEEQIFNDAVDSQGAPWPEHSPVTVAMHGPHPLLILSGNMKAAATGTGSGHIADVVDRSLVFGVGKDEIPYAGVHQDGYRNIPRREYLYITGDAADKCVERIAEHVDELIG